MLTGIPSAFTTSYKTGWIILLATAALMTANHLMLALVLDEPVLFLGYVAFNLYAVTVIAVPLRRGERWAWFASWILPLGLASPALFDPDPAVLMLYLTVAVAGVLGLLLMMPSVFAADRRARP